MFGKTLQKRAFSQAQLASMTIPGASYTARNQLFINGKWQDAKSGKTFDVINPGTGKLITKVSAGGKEDIDAAVTAARIAADKWERVTPF